MPHDSVIVTSHDTVPDFAAHPTIISVQDGLWSNPATWDQGRAPTESDIVSVVHAVNYDGDGAADVIGVTGTLRFAEDSHLLVTTLLSHGGTIDLGTACEIVIRDTPLDIVNDGVGTFDPYQFGHGVLCIDGVFRANGQPKTPFVRAEVVPEDWDVGDRVVAPDVRAINTGFEQCEVIAFGDPWEFDHTGGHVANLTRSIVVRSENPLGTRGHVMCMGSCKPDLRYVQFKDLGRTTAARLNVTIKAPVAEPIYTIGKNVQGRYSLHLHHLTDPDWNVEGCVFDGSPRWGLAIHDTHYGTVWGNIAFDCVGSGFVLEDGSETGNVLDSNIAILCRGSGDSPIASKPTRNALVDTAHEGSGFWARAGRNSWVNNVAANCRWAGWNTFSRAGHVGKPLPVMVPKFKGGPKIAFDARWSVPTAFTNNEVYSSHRGFEWWYAWVAMMDNCRVWNCVNKGLFFTYHGSALVTDTAVQGGSEGILGQHGTHLRAKRVTVDSAATSFIMEPNKKGILFEDVAFDGVAQLSPPYRPILDIEPAIDSTVSGIVALKFTGITAGQLVVAVNGKKLATDRSSPYSVNWNTANSPNGTAWVTAELGSDAAFFVGRFFVEN
jgi:hypothetical protein